MSVRRAVFIMVPFVLLCVMLLKMHRTQVRTRTDRTPSPTKPFVTTPPVVPPVSSSTTTPKIYSLPMNLMSGSNPAVRVRFPNGKVGDFELDTGAAACYVDRSVASWLGAIRYRTYADHPKQPLGWVHGGLTLGPDTLPLPDMYYQIMNITPANETTPDCAGLIGMSVFHHYAVCFDFHSHRVELIEGGKVAGTKYAPAGAFAVPIRVESWGHCWVETRVDGVKTRFLVDTGSWKTVLRDPRLVAQLKPAGTLSGYESHIFTGKSDHLEPVEARILRLHTLSVGGAQWNAPIVLHEKFKERYPKNLLGMDFLSRYRVVLDYPGKMLYLTPDLAYHALKSKPYIDVGIDFRKEKSGRIVTRYVFSPSPAQRAGVKAGDEVISIAGIHLKLATSAQLEAVYHAIYNPSAATEWRILRPGDTRPRTVHLKAARLL